MVPVVNFAHFNVKVIPEKQPNHLIPSLDFSISAWLTSRPRPGAGAEFAMANVDGGGNGSSSWSVDVFSYRGGDVDGATEGPQAACSMGMVASPGATTDSEGGSNDVSISN